MASAHSIIDYGCNSWALNGNAPKVSDASPKIVFGLRRCDAALPFFSPPDAPGWWPKPCFSQSFDTQWEHSGCSVRETRTFTNVRLVFLLLKIAVLTHKMRTSEPIPSWIWNIWFDLIYFNQALSLEVAQIPASRIIRKASTCGFWKKTLTPRLLIAAIRSQQLISGLESRLVCSPYIPKRDSSLEIIT